jgi:U3 small nucleolar RNA-associated protein 4
MRQFGKELSLGLPALPHTPPLVSAPEARLMVSWWNSEIRVWRVKGDEDGPEKPKVVARLALHGDENICSVTLSKDGGLLAVATVREVKMFQLLQTREAGTNLRIRKLELPSANGAKIVQFTPDGKWLALITASNEVHLTRVIRTADDPTDRPRALTKSLRLHRLQRDHSSNDPLNSSSGQYSRSISHAKFSDDGSILAVVDLAGYIDTWVTEGHEDLTALEVDVEELPGSVRDDDDSDDEELTQERVTLLGQRWIRNPSGHLLPRIDFNPVLLSFQPNPESLSRPEPNGNPAVHATRHNPHPRSHDTPDIEHRLLVVSADQQLYFFDVLAGRLSEWSRRNPPSSYPSQYRILKSPAKGCLWDVGEQERIWLYGEGWLFMFDLSRDLPISESNEMSNGVEGTDKMSLKKRKREAALDMARKGVSGAGDAVPERDAPVTKIRKYNGEQSESSTSMQVNLHTVQGATNSDEDGDSESAALATIRRGAVQNGTSKVTTNGIVNGDAMVEEESDGKAIAQRKATPDHFWHTFKYRPILGMVPVGGGEGGQPLEVVLVERPSWDLDLPPRFVGAHEA